MNTREKNSRLPPRPQHYSFAHKILPTFFFSDPARFIELVSKGGSEYMVGLWNLLEEDFTAAGLDPIAPDGLDVELVDLGDQASLILIKMPEPQQVAEAYIAAVAYRPDTPRIARFFTMEYDESLTDGSPRAFLCEWCHHLASMHDAVRTSRRLLGSTYNKLRVSRLSDISHLSARKPSHCDHNHSLPRYFATLP